MRAKTTADSEALLAAKHRLEQSWARSAFIFFWVYRIGQTQAEGKYVYTFYILDRVPVENLASVL